MNICKVDGCGRKVYGHGYCQKHYYQIKRYGIIRDRTRFTRNEIVCCGDYSEIIMYNRKSEEVARTKIDNDMVELASSVKWRLGRNGYAAGKYLGKQEYLHRLVFPVDTYVDHINRDKLDNRRVNLRQATHSQNCGNVGIQKRNKTGYKGVSFSDGKYYASIRIEGKTRSLGKFDTKEEAAIEYNKSAIVAFGEYAYLNRIE